MSQLNSKVRLNKRLVELELASSRRAADQLIATGKVKIGGVTVSQLATEVERSDEISLSSKIGRERPHLYVLLNKPVGYICSHSVQGERPTIFSLLPKSWSKLKIAGRLDQDSHGLLMLSSDGDFINQITHPSHHKTKHYQVKIDKPLLISDQKKLAQGVKLSDGISRLSNVTKITPTRLRLELSTGKNRQIRRTFDELGYKIVDLKRTQVGESLTLGGTKLGNYRLLTRTEAEKLCQS